MTKLIFALDVHDKMEAGRWVDILGSEVYWYKVGLELFLREGAGMVESIVGRGKKVFLDLKLHDIPRTVERAASQAGSMGVDMMTIHATGGRAMMEAAANAAASLKNPPKVVAVTVLTSLDANALEEIGLGADPRKWALELAKLAKKAGMDGVVASPLEAKSIKEACGKNFIVTPGIRMPDSKVDDQRRTATPSEAAKNADFIVVGRPIRDAPDPIAVTREINEMISADKTK